MNKDFIDSFPPIILNLFVNLATRNAFFVKDLLAKIVLFVNKAIWRLLLAHVSLAISRVILVLMDNTQTV